MHVEVETGGGSSGGRRLDELAETIDGARTKRDLMERFVADNGTVVGTFSIPDCTFAPVLWRWYRLPLSFEQLPRVTLPPATATAHPAFAAMGPVA